MTTSRRGREGGAGMCARLAPFACLVAVLWLVMVGDHTTVAQPASGDAPCPESAPPTSHGGAELEGFADERGEGVVFDDAASHLELHREGGNFRGQITALQDEFNAAVAGDFNNNGWPDMVVGSSTSSFIRFYANRTYENPEPNWSDPDDIREPKFIREHDIEPPGGSNGQHTYLAAGDFNQNGNLDFFYYRNQQGGEGHAHLLMQRIYLGNGDGTFQAPYDATENAADFGYMNWTSTNSVVTDWNGNGWPDILFGTKLGTSDDTGAVLVFLNDCPDVATSPPTPCSRNPRFKPQTVMTGLNLGNRGANAIQFADFTHNGIKDLLLGSPSYHGIRLYPGLEGGGFEEDYQVIDSIGAVSLFLVADFNLNGRVDFVYSTDNWNYGHNIGGRTFYYENDGTSTPFSSGATMEIESPAYVNDLDTGVVFDYDQDPDGTPDFLVADGNHSGTFFIFANRVLEEYVECGEVASGILDLGGLEDEEMVITAGRLRPQMSLPPGTSIDFYMANQTPPNWTKASPCPDRPGEYCASFDEPAGTDLQWRAVMCSDDSRTRSPALSGVEISYDYALARIHYRAGVVVHDGVAYAAGFSQPGSRGHLFALDAAVTTTYWDAGERLDDRPDADRRIYTATTDGKTQLEMSAGHADDELLVQTLRVADPDKARDVIEWARSPRFGLRGERRLGSIETSTPAVLSPPSRPVWYPTLSPDERSGVDDFIARHRDRPVLVLVGSRSGMLHAFRSRPNAIAAPDSGEEAWAFVPARIASRLEADMTSGQVSAYPDGSPTLADIRGPDGELMTVAVVNGGKGSRSVFALDVTETIDSTTGEVRGPTPLWDAIPGGADAGQARANPVVIRSLVDDAERFIAVLGSGPAHGDPDHPYNRGRDLLAVDAATGDELWRFRAACTLTSDISAFEQSEPVGDQEEEPAPGFIDRVAFADACGNVYLLDPGADVDGGYLDSSELGTLDTGDVDPDGRPVRAVFSTVATPGALGGERPIAGTIGARPDATGRTVLFFGTGGFASFDPGLQNAFYAVYADTGEIRHVLEGECTPDGCEKFYGGVVVTGSQVFVTRSIDPPVGSGLCEPGRSRLQALDLNTLSVGFEVDIDGRSVSPLFGHGGAVYATTESGSIVRVGTPSAPSPGDESDAGGGPGVSRDAVDTEVTSWRRLF